MTWPTVAELGDYLQTTIPDADPTATLLLDLAKATVRSAARQTFDAVDDDEVTLDGNGRSVLLLPERPVTAVASVVEDGDELTDEDDYEWSANGTLRRLGARAVWLEKTRAVVVTYDHGYATIPDDVRAVVLAAAGRAWSSPTAVQQETLGGYSVTYLADSRGVFLGAGEVDVIARYRSEGLA